MMESRGIAKPKPMAHTIQAQLPDYRLEIPLEEVPRLRSLALCPQESGSSKLRLNCSANAISGKCSRPCPSSVSSIALLAWFSPSAREGSLRNAGLRKYEIPAALTAWNDCLERLRGNLCRSY
jgi:hypothetical protein